MPLKYGLQALVSLAGFAGVLFGFPYHANGRGGLANIAAPAFLLLAVEFFFRAARTNVSGEQHEKR